MRVRCLFFGHSEWTSDDVGLGYTVYCKRCGKVLGNIYDCGGPVRVVLIGLLVVFWVVVMFVVLGVTR